MVFKYEGWLAGGPMDQRNDNLAMAGQGPVVASQKIEIKRVERLSEQFDFIFQLTFMATGFEVA
jgi:hypothetical protein